MKYEQIAELLHSIAERFEWDKVMEGDKIIGLKQVNQLSCAEEKRQTQHFVQEGSLFQF